MNPVARNLSQEHNQGVGQSCGFSLGPGGEMLQAHSGGWSPDSGSPKLWTEGLAGGC